MLARPLLAVLLLVPLACATSSSQHRGAPTPDPLTELASLENRRSLGAGRVVSLATGSEDPAIRARAHRVLARLQDPTTLAAVQQGLADPAAEVRAEAAFAAWSFGLSWSPLEAGERGALADAVLTREAVETDPKVRGRMLRALGRIGTPAANTRLVERLGADHPGVQIAAGIGLGVAVKRGDPLPEGALPALQKMIVPTAHEGVRFGAAYVLAFVKDPAAKPVQVQVLGDADAEVRLLGAKGLGANGCGSHQALAPALADPDWRVAVEATRALATCADREAVAALAVLEERVQSTWKGRIADRAQPLLALAQAKPNSALQSLVRRLRAGLQRTGADAASDRAKIDCRLAGMEVALSGELGASASCGGDAVDPIWREALFHRALSTAERVVDTSAIPRALEALEKGPPPVRIAALELVTAHAPPEAVGAALRAHVRGEDLPLAASAAAALGKLEGVAPERRAKDAALLRSLLGRLAEAPDIAELVLGALVAIEGNALIPELRALGRFPHAHVRNVVAGLLTSLTGTHHRAQAIDSAELDVPPPFAPGTRLRIRTGKGELVIALFLEDAPNTAATIAKLAREGYYANVPFHRVVPDFVVQGGDPRGDGEGGPGFTQRCEVSPRPYFSGTVGMALAGKDTGGSQFFVTHSPHPHLEGRYPVFGQLEAGQDVADALLEGDRILGIDVIAPE